MGNELIDINKDYSMEEVTKYIEDHKIDGKFQTYVETIIDMIDNNVFPGIIYENVKNFLHSSLIAKLEFEYGTKRYFKHEYRIEHNNIW